MIASYENSRDNHNRNLYQPLMTFKTRQFSVMAQKAAIRVCLARLLSSHSVAKVGVAVVGPIEYVQHANRTFVPTPQLQPQW